jgi:hypothetical protein
MSDLQAIADRVEIALRGEFSDAAMMREAPADPASREHACGGRTTVTSSHRSRRPRTP